ncbi:MAG: hypothetical protein ABIP75_02975 [Pyrinomonadaceae bacterium]
MAFFRRINLSLAVFVIICFFLPWVQVSCGGAHDTESGLALARGGERLLWLIPLMMIMVIALGLGRDWKRRILSFALVNVICGTATSILIFRERVTDDQAAGLIAIGMTAWFWLAFAAAIGLAVVGLAIILGRPPKGPIGS